MPKKNLSAKAVAKIKMFFELFDNNSDGAIEPKELYKMLEMNGQTITEKEVEEFMSKYDTNKDGQLTFDEFMKWWESLNQASKQ